MANELKFNSKVVFTGGQPITLPIAASDPGTATNGDMYYNSSSNKIRAYVNGGWHVIEEDAISSLTGDVSASGPGAAAATVNSVGGSSAANIHSAELLANAATAANTASAIVRRDASGNFVAGTITANLTGSASNNVLKAGDTMSGNLNMGGSNKVTNMADPTSAQDAATKFYVDNAVSGLDWKEHARVASTANVSVSSAPASIDGVTLASGNRILLKNQTDPKENGIYVFNGAASALTRATDADTFAEIVAAVLLVTEGTVNAGSKWVNTNVDGGTIGTDNITFVAFSIAGTINGTGTSGYVAYWSGVSTLTAEQYLSNIRGGTGGDSSAATGIAHVLAGVWSYSLIVNADVHASAAIAYSKLNLTGSIVNADINASAAIAYSKLNLAGSIVNADIATGAAIAYNKLAALTADRALQSDGSGFVSVSAVTATELGYVSGVTSAIQTQLNGKASTTLNNLGTTSINSDLLPSGDLARNVGSASLRWTGVFAAAVDSGAGALNLKTTGSNGSVIITANGSGNLDQKVTLLRQSENGASSNFTEQQYFDALTLAAGTSSPAAISSLSFAFASFDSVVLEYKIKEATTGKLRVGKFIVTTDGTIASYSDQYSETAQLGSASNLSLDAVVNGSNIDIRYNNTHATNASTMRVRVVRLRA